MQYFNVDIFNHFILHVLDGRKIMYDRFNITFTDDTIRQNYVRNG